MGVPLVKNRCNKRIRMGKGNAGFRASKTDLKDNRDMKIMTIRRMPIADRKNGVVCKMIIQREMATMSLTLGSRPWTGEPEGT
jgi:hypothetical protein